MSERFALALVLALCAGCGDEMGRLPFAAEGTAEKTFTFRAGEVNFWTDLDVTYDGDTALGYEITLEQDAQVVARGSCEATGRMTIKTMWVSTNVGNSHSRSGRGKMTCSTTLAKAGPTLVRARLTFSRRPETVTLKKADLVIKQ